VRRRPIDNRLVKANADMVLIRLTIR